MIEGGPASPPLGESLGLVSTDHGEVGAAPVDARSVGGKVAVVRERPVHLRAPQQQRRVKHRRRGGVFWICRGGGGLLLG
jgi:hypothetical protein